MFCIMGMCGLWPIPCGHWSPEDGNHMPKHVGLENLELINKTSTASLSICRSFCKRLSHQIQTSLNHPKESTQHSAYGESVKSRTTCNVINVVFVLTVNIDTERDGSLDVSNLSLTGYLRQSYWSWYSLSKSTNSQLLMEHAISLPCAQKHYASQH
jgi:hypothetical protein